MEFKITFDPLKDEKNIEKHGISLSEAEFFDWECAKYAYDLRNNYGEKRIIAIGRIKQRLHVMIFTPRVSSLRIISLRKANKREQKKYEEKG